MFHRVDPAKEHRFHLVLNQLNKGYKPMAVECSLRVLPRWSYQCLLQTARSNFPPNPAQEARHEAPKAAKQAKPPGYLVNLGNVSKIAAKVDGEPPDQFLLCRRTQFATPRVLLQCPVRL